MATQEHFTPVQPSALPAWQGWTLGLRVGRLLCTPVGDLLAGRVLPAFFFMVVLLAKMQSLAVFLSQARSHGLGASAIVFVAETAQRLSAILFLVLVVTFFVARLRPVKRCTSPRQILTALVGSFMMSLVAGTTPAAHSVALSVLSAVIMLLGSVVSAAALLTLGPAFSVTPEARRLVRRGLYAHVRHPMYLGEIVGSLGMVVAAWTAPALLIFVAFVWVQTQRMRYEESVLQQTFPEYLAYRRMTARLIPKLY